MKLRHFVTWAAISLLAGVGRADETAPAIPDKLDLHTALQYALDNNLAIKQAREQIEEQEGLIMTIRGQVLPNVSASAGYNRFDKGLSEPMGTIPQSYQSWQLGVEVRQLLYSGGGVSAALDAQKFTRSAAMLKLQSTINDSLLQVRTDFYNVLLAREKIEVQEQNLKLLEEQLATVENRYSAGTVSQFEVLRAEVEVANAKPALIQARNEFRIAIDSLRQQLGYVNGPDQSTTKIPEFVGELTYEPVNFDLTEALKDALNKRPELEQLESLVHAREAGVTVARSDYLPEVSLVGGYQVNKASRSNSFDDSLDGWTVGVQGTWSIFDGKRTAGQVRQARSQLRQAQISYDDLRLSIEVEVRRAFSNLTEAAELAEAAVKVVEQADEAVRLADARYDAGAATQLDVLQARVALTQARTNRLQANYSYLVAEAAMRKAIGESDQMVMVNN